MPTSGAPNLTTIHGAKAPFALPALPYADNALAAVISSNTLGFHYGKHHKAYVDNLNKLVAGTAHADSSLEAIIKATAGKPAEAGVFNNAAQIWNHTFYWHSLRAGGGGKPGKALLDRIEKDFGSFDAMKDEFTKAGADAVRQRLGLAGGQGRQARRQQDRQRRHPDGPRRNAAADHRRVGTRLLPGLPEPPAGLRRGGARQADQLGLRGSERRLEGDGARHLQCRCRGTVLHLCTAAAGPAAGPGCAAP